jgi:uncharacterized OB-fold protein
MIPVLQKQPHFRETPEGIRLIATRCLPTQDFVFPPDQFRWGPPGVQEELLLEPEGVLYSFTVVHLGRDKAPYALAMVDFPGGLRVFGPLLFEPGTRPTIGSTVKTVAHALADGTPDYAFSVVEVSR